MSRAVDQFVLQTLGAKCLLKQVTFRQWQKIDTSFMKQYLEFLQVIAPKRYYNVYLTN
jgi:hypothetical protein